MKKVFISGPYSNGDIERNVIIAMDLTRDLINENFATYCPHLKHFLELNQSQPHEKWLDIDLVFLKSCNAPIRFEGDSEGADKEVEFALKNHYPSLLLTERLSKVLCIMSQRKDRLIGCKNLRGHNCFSNWKIITTVFHG